MQRKGRYDSDGVNVLHREGEKYDKHSKPHDQECGQYQESKPQHSVKMLDLVLYICQILALAQVVALLLLFSLKFSVFSTMDDTGNTLRANAVPASSASSSLQVSTNVTNSRTSSESFRFSRTNSLERVKTESSIGSNAAVEKSYALRFEGSGFSLGDIVHFLPQRTISRPDAPWWVAKAQAAKCTAQIVDISALDPASRLYLVVASGWAGDAAVWLREDGLEKVDTTGLTTREYTVPCLLPGGALAREVYSDEMHSVCSDKIQEFCMQGFVTHDATAGNSNFDCYVGLDAGVVDLGADFYRAQDLMAAMGFCPHSSQLKWIPDSITHPLCSSALAADSKLTSSVGTVGDGLRDVEENSAALVARQAAVESTGQCPSCKSFRWVPDELMFPRCASALKKACCGQFQQLQALCDFPPSGTWTEENRAHLAMLQDSDAILDSGDCPFSGLSMWVPLDVFYPRCSSAMATLCVGRGKGDLCRYNFGLRYSRQLAAAKKGLCPHPSEAFRWPYDTRKQLP